jgi:hypothetical protein
MSGRVNSTLRPVAGVPDSRVISAWMRIAAPIANTTAPPSNTRIITGDGPVRRSRRRVREIGVRSRSRRRPVEVGVSGLVLFDGGLV